MSHKTYSINYIKNEKRALYKESKVSYHFIYNDKKVYVLLVNNKSLTSGALGYMDLLKKE